MTDALIFDLDETITDRTASLTSYAGLFHRDFSECLEPTSIQQITEVFLALDDRGYRPRDQVFVGILETMPWVRTPPLSVVGEHWRKWFPYSAVGRVGLHETLRSLSEAGIRLGIVTNGGEYPQSTKIARLNIGHYFSAVIISEVVGFEKPDPRILRCAIEQMGCEANKTLFVGDHPTNDVLGSGNVGLIPVWFEGVHAWPSLRPHPERRVRSLPEVLQFVFSSGGRAA